MKVEKNLHAIWITYNRKLPDCVLHGIEIWKKTLPDDWNLCFWCNRSEIEPKYLNYLSSLGVMVLDVQTIILSAHSALQDKLNWFLVNGQDVSYLHVKLFSDIMRMLLMNMQGSSLFSGIYLDITGAVPSENTIERLQNLDLAHGFAFRIQGKKHDHFDSNICIFSPASEFQSDTLARKLTAVYVARLANWTRYDLQTCANMTKPSVTNIYNLLSEKSGITTLCTGDIINTDDIDAGKLLALPPDQGDPENTYARDLEAFASENVAFDDSLLLQKAIVFPSGDYSIIRQCPTLVPLFSPRANDGFQARQFSCISHGPTAVEATIFSASNRRVNVVRNIEPAAGNTKQEDLKDGVSPDEVQCKLS